MTTHTHRAGMVAFTNDTETRLSHCTVCKNPIKSIFIEDDDRMDFWTDWKVTN